MVGGDAGDVTPSAAAMSTRPQPAYGSHPAGPKSRAVSVSFATAAEFDNSGCAESSNASAPETKAAAGDVPLLDVYCGLPVALQFVVTMLSPGAAMLTHDP